MPSYPTICGFPIPGSNGFSLSPKKALSSVNTEGRLSRSKSLITNNIYVCNFTFTFTKQADRDTFRKWFLYELNYGNLWFNADWLALFGFTAGDWVFRFTNPISIDLTGYKDSFKATLLMGPKNANTIVPGVFVENGIAGSYIDQVYPYNLERYQCYDDLTYTPIVRFNSQTLKIGMYVFNGSNFTEQQIGNLFTCPADMINVQAIEWLGGNTFAVVGNSADTTINLRMMKWDGLNFSQVGTVKTLISNSCNPSIARLSDTRIAYWQPTQKALRTYDFDIGTGLWTQTGVDLVISDVTGILGTNSRASITALSSSRIAFWAQTNVGLVRKLRAYDFIASAWGLFGTEFTPTAPLVSSADNDVCSLTANKIVYSNSNLNTNDTYGQKLTEFNMTSLGVWSQGVSSALDITLQSIRKTSISSSRFVSSYISDLTTYELASGAFAKVGNTKTIAGIVSDNGYVASYFPL